MSNPQADDNLGPSTQNDPILKTIHTVNALVERIYDNQSKFGVWQGEREDSEDYGAYVAMMHAKLSSAFQGLAERSNPPFEMQDPVETMTEALLEVAADAFGLLRRNGVDVGKAFLELVMNHAMEAAALAKAEEELAAGTEEAANEEEAKTP